MFWSGTVAEEAGVTDTEDHFRIEGVWLARWSRCDGFGKPSPGFSSDAVAGAPLSNKLDWADFIQAQ